MFVDGAYVHKLFFVGIIIIVSALFVLFSIGVYVV